MTTVLCVLYGSGIPTQHITQQQAILYTHNVHIIQA